MRSRRISGSNLRALGISLVYPNHEGVEVVTNDVQSSSTDAMYFLCFQEVRLALRWIGSLTCLALGNFPCTACAHSGLGQKAASALRVRCLPPAD